MVTISAIKLRRLLAMVPDNTPVYVVGGAGENGIITNVSLESSDEKNFNGFEARIEYTL